MLAKDGSESISGKPWKVEYVKHKDSKAIKGWSKSKNGGTVDYAFGAKINNPDASIGVQCSTVRIVCSHKVVAVGFNTLCYDASVEVLNPPHE